MSLSSGGCLGGSTTGGAVLYDNVYEKTGQYTGRLMKIVLADTAPLCVATSGLENYPFTIEYDPIILNGQDSVVCKKDATMHGLWVFNLASGVSVPIDLYDGLAWLSGVSSNGYLGTYGDHAFFMGSDGIVVKLNRNTLMADAFFSAPRELLLIASYYNSYGKPYGETLFDTGLLPVNRYAYDPESNVATPLIGALTADPSTKAVTADRIVGLMQHDGGRVTKQRVFGYAGENTSAASHSLLLATDLSSTIVGLED